MKTKTNLTQPVTSESAVISGRTDCTSIAERNYPLNGQSVSTSGKIRACRNNDGGRLAWRNAGLRNRKTTPPRSADCLSAVQCEVRGVGEGRRAPPVTSHALIILITRVRASTVPWRLILPSDQQSLSAKTTSNTVVGE